MNVSFKDSISPEELIKIFRQEIEWQPWLGHLDVFLGEMPSSLIQRFMAENGFNFEQLSVIYHSLPSEWQRQLFQEMYNAAMESIVK
jgi:hypothetical protein